MCSSCVTVEAVVAIAARKRMAEVEKIRLKSKVKRILDKVHTDYLQL